MKARIARAVSAAALISCLTAGTLAQYSHPAHAAGKTLHIAWFEFSPADVLNTLGQQYGRETGTTIIVDRPPNTQWYTSVFNQFAAHKTSFAAAALDSQWIGQAVT